MEKRKMEEREFHNKVRLEFTKESPKMSNVENANTKFYKVASMAEYGRRTEKKYTKKLIQGKKVLDYCCGRGWQSVELALDGAKKVVGIDISDISIEASRKYAAKHGVSDKCEFIVMDAENLTFEDNTFDFVWISGILHHLDLPKAYSEIARVLKVDGTAICTEGLRHNPVFQLYRRKTPHLRTAWETEHILGRSEIYSARKYFNRVRVLGCYYLFVLLAAPFSKFRFSKHMVKFLACIDRVMLKIPGFKWLAWMALFELKAPKKTAN